ncbi:sister-chromatid cohesion protein 3 [Tanacetum coccineum]
MGAGVRKASILALQDVYDVDGNVPSHGLFAERFYKRMLDLADDNDISVAALVYDHVISQKFNSPQSRSSGDESDQSQIHLLRMLQILREFSTDHVLSLYVIDDIWEFMDAMKVTGILDWLGNGSQWVVLYMSSWSELYRHTCYLFFSSVILDWLGVSKATEMTASVSKAAEMQKLLQGNPLLLSTYYDMKGFMQGYRNDCKCEQGCRNYCRGSEDYNQAEDYEDYVEARDDV